MGAYLQLFKDFFLLITTGYIIFWFLKDYRKAIIWYLIFYAVIAILGLTRVIYNENIVIPALLLTVITFQSSRTSKTNVYYVIFFIYMLFITYINKLVIVDVYSDGAYLLVIILIFSNYLFKNGDYAIKIVFLIWIITIAFAFNSVLYGENIFSIGSINSEERNLIIDAGIKGSHDSELGVDLNYFSSTQAIGGIITLMFIIYRKYLLTIVSIPPFLKKIFYNTGFPKVLYILLGLEVWLIFRGISRGGLLIFFSGIIAFMLLLKKQKYVIYGGLCLIALYFVMNEIGIIDLLVERINRDDTGTSGRNLIILGMLGSVYSQGGISQIIFGGGNAWPWWEFWNYNPWDTGFIPSSHNQWLSIFVNFGLLGLGLFIIPLFNGIRNCMIHKNPINNMRIVLFISLFMYFMSLEPLIYTHYAWFVLALSASYTPNIKSIHQ